MTYHLSLLDKSPIPPGSSAAAAFETTLRAVQRAEALGYRRYWLAEHHASPLLAGAAPEVLAAFLLARTSRIRIGTGGVMLQHYSAYKVAEVFRVLTALAPGRVDLGIGKSPGGLPLSTRALQGYHDPARKPGFEEQLAELDSWLNDVPVEGRALATPVPPTPPARYLLGGSPESAALAAERGWQFVYAGHFNGDPANIERSLRAYADRTGEVPLLAVYAFAADSAEAARVAVAGLKQYRVTLPTGQSVNLPSKEAAAEFARQGGHASFDAQERQPQVIAGTPDEVQREFETLHARWGVTEFVIDTPVPEAAARLRSIEHIAAAHNTIPA